MKSEVRVCQVKPHPECYGSPPVPWLSAVVPVSMCCGLDSSETLQRDSQDALIPPEATAPSASETLLETMLHLKDLIVFRHTGEMGKGKGSLCPPLGWEVTEGQGRYVRLQETLASHGEQAVLISVE